MVALMATVVVVVPLASCSLPSQKKVDCSFQVQDDSGLAYGRDVAIVMAPTENFVYFGNVLDASESLINDAIGLAGANVTVVLADGRPSVTRSLLPQIADSEDGARILNRRIVGSIRDVYLCSAGQSEQTVINPTEMEAEVDFISSLGVAAGALASGSAEEKRIVMMGNGIQTAGQYSFSKSGIPSEAQVGDIVGDLKSQGALPDLKGATVDFVGLGLVNSSEPPLNQQSLDGLVAFWRAIVAAAGGRVGTIMTQIVDGAPSPDSIAVAAVEGLKDACINESVAAADGISFNPGNAEFIDVGAATATAQNIATKIAAAACPGDITVIGYVASATPQAQYVFGNAEDEQLSLARAEAFKALLINAGVATNIVTVGAGKGPVNDWDEAGNFVENLGQQNRKIVVTQ
jgi:outer membrane protein OmpA-like peptidoglycan-associated protein